MTDRDVATMMDAAKSAVALFVKDADLAPTDLLWDIDKGAANALIEIARASAFEIRAGDTTSLSSVHQAVISALTDEPYSGANSRLVRLLMSP